MYVCMYIYIYIVLYNTHIIDNNSNSTSSSSPPLSARASLLARYGAKTCVYIYIYTHICVYIKNIYI